MPVSPRLHPGGDRVALGVIPVLPRYLTAFPVNILKHRGHEPVHPGYTWYKWYIFHPHRITSKRMAALEVIITDCTYSKVVHVPPVQNYAYRTNLNCIYNNCDPGCSIILIQSGTYTTPSELSLAIMLITN